nr:hypothetical protein [Micromonospora sp. DSM 115978]
VKWSRQHAGSYRQDKQRSDDENAREKIVHTFLVLFQGRPTAAGRPAPRGAARDAPGRGPSVPAAHEGPASLRSAPLGASGPATLPAASERRPVASARRLLATRGTIIRESPPFGFKTSTRLLD